METLLLALQCVGLGLSLDLQIATDKAMYALQRQGCPMGNATRTVQQVQRNGRTYWLAIATTTKGGK